MATQRATTRRRSRSRGAAAVEELKTTVDALIKENRILKRQLAKLQAAGATNKPGPRSNPMASGLRTIQRRVERALQSTPTDSRRRRTSSRASSTRASRARSTAARARRPASPETQRKRLEALARAREVRAAKKAAASSEG